MGKALELGKIAHELRIDIARLFYQSQTGHMAPALSCIDIFTVLYFGDIVYREKLFSKERDRIILSKGHACAALYVVLARLGYFPRQEFMTFYQKNSRLGGHPNVLLPGIETATGSLGHGICFATGTAKAAQLDKKNYKTYVVMGDGENQEGSVWEAAMFAAKENLNNLIVIIDRNQLQASARIEEIGPLEPLADKWRAFGWDVKTVDGHDFSALQNVLNEAKWSKKKPVCIIANTVKGKGISIAENSEMWHSRAPKAEEWPIVCKDLGIRMEDLKTI